MPKATCQKESVFKSHIGEHDNFIVENPQDSYSETVKGLVHIIVRQHAYTKFITHLQFQVSIDLDIENISIMSLKQY